MFAIVWHFMKKQTKKKKKKILEYGIIFSLTRTVTATTFEII